MIRPKRKNKILTTVKDTCAMSGLKGKFTNHSLRATAASRMYTSNILEQVNKEVIGHKSDYVRYYKRTSDGIRQNASSTISGETSLSNTKTISIEHAVPGPSFIFQEPPVLPEVRSLVSEMVHVIVKESEPPLKCTSAHVGSPGTLTLCQMIHNVATMLLLPGSAQCNGINIRGGSRVGGPGTRAPPDHQK